MKILLTSALVCAPVLAQQLASNSHAPKFSVKEQKFESISVVFNSVTNTFDVSNTFDDSADAYGKYYKNYQGQYWNHLDVFAQSEVDSVADHQLYSKAIGFLEGYVTCQEISVFYGNFYSATFGTDRVGKKTIDFLNENYEWLQGEVKKYSQNAEADEDLKEYWYSVGTTLQQLQGLYEGFNSNCGAKDGLAELEAIPYAKYDYSDSSRGLKFEQFLLINAWGDLYQITTKFNEVGKNSRLHGSRKHGRPSVTTESLSAAKVGAENDIKLIQRCSAIVKLLPDLSDVVFGHATWDSYESLGPRIFKHYSFPLVRKGFAEHHYDTYFSSSPALLSSIDDFFVVSGYAQLGVMETTNNLYNNSLLSLVKPQSVLSWNRAIVSNQLASSGADWVQQFAKYASGTYTNQWMSIDFKLFTPGQLPAEGFFNVFEEVPGLVHYEDQTASLSKDFYWPSYNNPFYDDITEASGYAALCNANKKYCHESAPRAYLFQQYQTAVKDVSTGGWLLSYNSFQTDAASNNDSCDTIACRGDLEPKVISRGGFGALDAKVTSVLSAKRFPGNAPQILARLGPTHDQQDAFCWSQLADEQSYVHRGQPDCFNFDWVTFPPTD